MPRATATLGTIAALAIGTPCLGQGVQERQDVHLRNDCRLARQILEEGHPHPHRDWALNMIGSCDESGGEVIPSLWQDAPQDLDELEQLVWSSARLRDQRIMDAVMAVANDRSRAVAVRLSALRVLAYYYSPRVYVTLDMLEAPESSEQPLPSLGSTFDFEPREGTAPLSAGTPEHILEFLCHLSATAEDPAVQGAAGHLVEQLPQFHETQP